jgi:hypothetical protein
MLIAIVLPEPGRTAFTTAGLGTNLGAGFGGDQIGLQRYPVGFRFHYGAVLQRARIILLNHIWELRAGDLTRCQLRREFKKDTAQLLVHDHDVLQIGPAAVFYTNNVGDDVPDTGIRLVNRLGDVNARLWWRWRRKRRYRCRRRRHEYRQ